MSELFDVVQKCRNNEAQVNELEKQLRFQLQRKVQSSFVRMSDALRLNEANWPNEIVIWRQSVADEEFFALGCG